MILLSLQNCTKDKGSVSNTIYIFTVLDEFTKRPIPNCLVLLQTTNSYSTYHTRLDSVGRTDSNGRFVYIFDKIPYQGTDGYADDYQYFDMKFINDHYSNFTNYHKCMYGHLEQKIIRNIPVTIQLNQNTTHCIVATRINAPGIVFKYSTSAAGNIQNQPMNSIYYHYETVPSNYSIVFTWATYPPLGQYTTLNIYSGHNDTTYLNINY